MKIDYLILCIIFFFFFFFFFFAACEYDRDEVYYVDVQKPDEAEVILNLADFPAGATIYIYEKTRVYYQLSLPEGELLKRRFSLTRGELYSMGDYLELIPTGSTQNTDKLIVEIEIDPKSESIAGKLGLENYIGRFE